MAVLNANIRIFHMGVITEVTPCISGLISRGRLKLSRRDKADRLGKVGGRKRWFPQAQSWPLTCDLGHICALEPGGQVPFLLVAGWTCCVPVLGQEVE